MDVGENPTISEENESIAASKPNQQVATDNSGEESESDSSDEDLPDVDDEGILELQKAVSLGLFFKTRPNLLMFSSLICEVTPC